MVSKYWDIVSKDWQIFYYHQHNGQQILRYHQQRLANIISIIVRRELITIPHGGVAALPPSFLVNQLQDLMARYYLVSGIWYLVLSGQPAPGSDGKVLSSPAKKRIGLSLSHRNNPSENFFAQARPGEQPKVWRSPKPGEIQEEIGFL